MQERHIPSWSDSLTARPRRGAGVMHGERFSEEDVSSRSRHGWHVVGEEVAVVGGYRVICFRGSPAVAIPQASRRLRLAAVDRIHGFTPKRLAFRTALRAAIRLGLDRPLGRAVVDPIRHAAGLDFSVWLEDHARSLGVDLATAAVIWPWPPGVDRGRVYVHLLDAAGRPLAFCKLVTWASEDAALQTEERMLASFEATPTHTARIPAVLDSGFLSTGRRYLTVEPLPARARPVPMSLANYPAQAVAEIAADRVWVERTSVLESLEWWSEALAAASLGPRFVNRLVSGLDRHGVRLCRVHGDFESKNLLREGSRLWVVDWECASLSGPRLVDPVRYFLSVHRRGLRRDPDRVLDDLLSWQAAQDPVNRIDVALALAYLAGAQCMDADRVIGRWEAREEAW